MGLGRLRAASTATAPTGVVTDGDALRTQRRPPRPWLLLQYRRSWPGLPLQHRRWQHHETSTFSLAGCDVNGLLLHGVRDDVVSAGSSGPPKEPAALDRQQQRLWARMLRPRTFQSHGCASATSSRRRRRCHQAWRRSRAPQSIPPLPPRDARPRARSPAVDKQRRRRSGPARGQAATFRRPSRSAVSGF